MAQFCGMFKELCQFNRPRICSILFSRG
jgi:hypothetical protein